MDPTVFKQIINNKGSTKHCVFKGCRSDSRYNNEIQFSIFPKPCLSVRKQLQTCDENHQAECILCEKSYRWARLCNRLDEKFQKSLAIHGRSFYICMLHFVDGDTSSDPLPAHVVLGLKEPEPLLKSLLRGTPVPEYPEVVPAKRARQKSGELAQSKLPLLKSLLRTSLEPESVSTSEIKVEEPVITLEGSTSPFIKSEIGQLVLEETVLETKTYPESTHPEQSTIHNAFISSSCHSLEEKKVTRSQQTRLTWKDTDELKEENETLKKEITALKTRNLKLELELEKMATTVLK